MALFHSEKRFHSIVAEASSSTRLPYHNSPSSFSFLVSPIEATTARGTGHISCLFPEILTIIFSHLDVRDKGRVARVCLAWKEAAYNKTVWKGVEARLHLRRTHPALFPSLVQRGIQRIQVVSVKRSVSDLVEGVPGLRSLNLSGCYNVTDVIMTHALSHDLPSLVSLNLSLCKVITDSTIACIAGHQKQLQELELGGCAQITTNALLLLACGLSNLRRLNLRSCCKITDEGVAYLTGQSHTVPTGTAMLEHIVLQDCQKITDVSLKYLSLGFSQLKSVNLSFCTGVTDSGLECLSRMPSLQELDLRACDGISDHGVGYLAEGLTRLSVLHLSFCDRITDTALLHISHGLIHLTALSLCDCSISDEGIQHLIGSSQDIVKLNIGQCDRLTDASLELIAQNFTQLHTIDIYGCTRITKLGVKHLRDQPHISAINMELFAAS
ncbi:hypothetical protein CAPTEDRAFT_102929 [Capitella teleta]|uniref:Uncharacterized protein n=1 Tax=Capitella teleta TaxID=283909 RepID=R7UZ96_CAPTE|nr:hypothetical protein CAPTEDRAFT_102929 [Capitella teleta]|eukprot:ELU11898.1 hypothetical protein CAPTEDRAFT_102929 [Capitella teleta]